MKKAVFLTCALALLLGGCAAAEPAWETVDDTVVLDAGSYLDSAYTMLFDVPADAREDALAAAAGRTVYTNAAGDYEIVGQTLLCADADTAVRRLSGFSPEELDVIETTRFGLPEYRFAWYTSGDEGGSLCRADVLLDGTYCYALTFSARESCGNTYDSTAQRVFATLSLFEDEGF